ncbi:MAG: DUF3570 domain-containing protein [Deltaproteobacteria bacterium]|nr:DUF3570 domain-containing protein [Deltaproteobacteria bacterium]
MLVLGGVARADEPAAPDATTDAAILGTDPGWRVEGVDLRVVYFDQQGHGYQSQDGPTTGPGDEATTIIEPWVAIQLRQSATVRHEVVIPVDVVTAASPDALDAMTSASRRNEAAGVDVRTSIKRSDVTTLSTHVAFHWEEPLSSGTLGAGWRRSLADDNAAIAVNANLTVDGFDINDVNGRYQGKSARETGNLNLAASQLLSPTTVIDGSYGVTWQHGTLAQTWNAVPVDGGEPIGELFPSDRVRHAFTGRIAQHVPQTRSTVKAWYRYYRDDFGVRAHTVELSLYQYVVPWLYVRGGARFHRQNGASFFTTGLPAIPMPGAPRTADSDLAPFDARELSLGLAIVPDRAPKALRGIAVTVEALRYWRDNDLVVHAGAIGVARRF